MPLDDAEVTVGADIEPLLRKLAEARAALDAFKADTNRGLGGPSEPSLGGLGRPGTGGGAPMRNDALASLVPPTSEAQRGLAGFSGRTATEQAAMDALGVSERDLQSTQAADAAARMRAATAAQEFVQGRFGAGGGTANGRGGGRTAAAAAEDARHAHLAATLGLNEANRLFGQFDAAQEARTAANEARRLYHAGMEVPDIAALQGRIPEEVISDLGGHTGMPAALGMGAFRSSRIPLKDLRLSSLEGDAAAAQRDLLGGSGGGGNLVRRAAAASGGGGGGGLPGMMPMLGGLALGGIGALGPAAGGAALAVGGSAATLGLAGFGAALDILPVIHRMESANKALRESVMPAITALDAMKRTFDGLTGAVRPEIVAAMASGLHDIQGALGHMKPLLEGSAKGFEVVAKIFGEFTNNQGFAQFMTWAGGEAPIAMGDAMRTLTNVFIGFGNVLQGSTPLINGFMGTMKTWTGDFAQWAQHLSTNKGWQTFLKDAQADMPLVGNVLGGLGKALGDLYGALKPAGAPVLKILADLANGLGPDIKTLGKDLAPVWPPLGKLLEQIAIDLPKVLNDLLKALGPVIGGIAHALAALERLQHIGGHHGHGGFNLFDAVTTGGTIGTLWAAARWKGPLSGPIRGVEGLGRDVVNAGRVATGKGGDPGAAGGGLWGTLAELAGAGAQGAAQGGAVGITDALAHGLMPGAFAAPKAIQAQMNQAQASINILKAFDPSLLRTFSEPYWKQGYNFAPSLIYQSPRTQHQLVAAAEQVGQQAIRIEQTFNITGAPSRSELALIRAEIKKSAEDLGRQVLARRVGTRG